MAAFFVISITLVKQWSRSSRDFAFYCPNPKDGEGIVFTGVCLSTGGYPSPRFFQRSLVPGPFLRGYPSPKFFPRSLVSGPFPGEYPSPAKSQSPVTAGGSSPGQGYPQPGLGYPSLRQNSRASTCYAAGSVPLAVTQEDFLVLN